MTAGIRRTLYGFREPRGGDPVSMEEIGEVLARLSTGLPAGAVTVRDALTPAGVRPPVAEAIRARLEISCTHDSDHLESAVLAEGAGAFGRFDTFTVAGGNDALAHELAGVNNIRLSTPVRKVTWSTDTVQVSGERFEAAADALVLAVPASVTGELQFDPPLPTAKLAALRGVCFGHAAKLFVALRSPAPPSATMSVPERYWCYTQLGADGFPLPFVAAFAGTAAALDALEVRAGSDRWLGSLAALRPDLDLAGDTILLSRWDPDSWARGAYSARSVRAPMDDNELARPVGPISSAGEHTAGAWHGLMEGALRSGTRAARELLRRSG